MTDPIDAIVITVACPAAAPFVAVAGVTALGAWFFSNLKW